MPQKSETTVAVQTLEESDLEDYIEFGGSVQAVDSFSVFPTVAGKISKILVEAGERVRKNQIIAQVDASKPGADFTVSSVRAAAEGTVISIPVSVGSYVTTSSALAEIASTENLEIIINVSERFLPSIQKNQSAEISFKSYPDEVFSAEITKIAPVLDPVTRTMQVNLKVGDTKGLVKSGMFAHVKLLTQKKEGVLSVPDRAIVQNNGKSFVFALEEAGGKATVRRIAVEKGLSVDGVTEITSGLFAGQKIVVKGQNMISDGQSVLVAE